MPWVFMAAWASTSVVAALAIGRILSHLRVREAAMLLRFDKRL